MHKTLRETTSIKLARPTPSAAIGCSSRSAQDFCFQYLGRDFRGAGRGKRVEGCVRAVSDLRMQRGLDDDSYIEENGQLGLGNRGCSFF